MIDQLKPCEFIDSELNIMIQSATGGRKTFFACAYGNDACEHGYTVRYFIMPDLMSTYHTQESKGKGEKFLRKLVNTNLVIIDDFMLTRITSEDADFLYRLISSKPRSSFHRSFLICSQLMPEEMYNRLSQAGGAIADTIMNRLTAKAYTITLEGDSKLHKVIRSNQMIPCPISTRDHRFLCRYQYTGSVSPSIAGLPVPYHSESMLPKSRRPQFFGIVQQY